jgi:hypothetical protein
MVSWRAERTEDLGRSGEGCFSANLRCVTPTASPAPAAAAVPHPHQSEKSCLWRGISSGTGKNDTMRINGHGAAPATSGFSSLGQMHAPGDPKPGLGEKRVFT